MQANGIVEREEAPPPIATTLFRLTERGQALGPVLAALGAWGMPLLHPQKKGANFRTRNLKLPLQLYLTAASPGGKPLTLVLRTGDEPLTIRIAPGATVTQTGAAKNPDLVVTGDPHSVLGLLLKRIPLQQAASAGIRFEGVPALLDQVAVRYLPS